jgi:hypothetical protein
MHKLTNNWVTRGDVLSSPGNSMGPGQPLRRENKHSSCKLFIAIDQLLRRRRKRDPNSRLPSWICHHRHWDYIPRVSHRRNLIQFSRTSQLSCIYRIKYVFPEKWNIHIQIPLIWSCAWVMDESRKIKWAGKLLYQEDYYEGVTAVGTTRHRVAWAR